MYDHDPIAPTAGSPEVRLSVQAEPSSVALARDLVRDALTAWSFDRELIHDSMLVMSEIVTNAIAANPGRRIHLRCALHNGAPLLECWDPSPCLPVRRVTPETAESGRGLTIVAAYVKEHGTRLATPEGKIVWALMPA